MSTYRRDQATVVTPLSTSLARAADADLLPKEPGNDPNVAARGIRQRAAYNQSLPGDKEDWYALEFRYIDPSCWSKNNPAHTTDKISSRIKSGIYPTRRTP
jgi:hypothetical protein